VSPKLTFPDLSSGVRECHGEVGMSIKISRRVAECPRCVRYGALGHPNDYPTHIRVRASVVEGKDVHQGARKDDKW